MNKNYMLFVAGNLAWLVAVVTATATVIYNLVMMWKERESK